MWIRTEAAVRPVEAVCARPLPLHLALGLKSLTVGRQGLELGVQ